MDFVINNYVWFIVIGVVLVLALIGYIADNMHFEKKASKIKEKNSDERQAKKEKKRKERNNVLETADLPNPELLDEVIDNSGSDESLASEAQVSQETTGLMDLYDMPADLDSNPADESALSMSAVDISSSNENISDNSNTEISNESVENVNLSDVDGAAGDSSIPNMEDLYSNIDVNVPEESIELNDINTTSDNLTSVIAEDVNNVSGDLDSKVSDTTNQEVVTDNVNTVDIERPIMDQPSDNFIQNEELDNMDLPINIDVEQSSTSDINLENDSSDNFNDSMKLESNDIIPSGEELNNQEENHVTDELLEDIADIKPILDSSIKSMKPLESDEKTDVWN